MRLWLPLLFALSLGLRASAQTNDSFANRLTLSGPAPCAVSNNLHATRETGEPNHAGDAAGRSLWYTWTAPTTGTVNIGTYATFTGAPTMRAVAVYTGNSLASLSEVASSNDQAQAYYLEDPYYYPLLTTGGTSVNVPVTAGVVYQIAVDALAGYPYFPDDGTVVLAINAPPTILSAANVSGTTGASFAYTVIASAGATAYAATGLPAGLAFNATSGQITGVPAAAGTYSIGLSATAPGGTGTGTLTLCVMNPAPVLPVVPVIDCADSVWAYVGVAFSESIYATGSPTAYTATNLPAGLSFNASTGVISGTPTAVGSTAVPLSATGPGGTGTGTLTILVATPPVPIITGELTASGTTGTSFSYNIDTNLDGYSGLAPTSFSAGNLPPGLSLSTTSNQISGTPTQAGVYTVPISATNASGTRQATVTMTISAPVTPTPTLAAPVLNSVPFAYGIVGTAFGYTLAASNTPTNFSASNLPAGLTFNTASGTFAGTPTAAGTFLVPVTATNAYGTSPGTLTITVFASAAAENAAFGTTLPVIVSAASAGGYTGQAFTYGITATYDGSPYPNGYGSNSNWTFSATGLPPGLSVTGSTYPYGFGTISGTPTQAGTYQATISATCPASTSSYDGYPAHPASTGTAVVTFIIQTGPSPVAPIITGSATATGIVGASTSYSPSATGTPTSYTANGLPAGLSINATTGTVSGTPTTAGTSQATLSATNGAGTGTATVTFIIAAQGAAPLITSAATASGTVGSSFSYYMYVSGSATSYGASTLPPGLSFTAGSNYISGTPTQAGTYTVPISATNAAGTANATLTITVLPSAVTRAPAITSYAVAQATTGQSFYYYIDTDVTATSYAVGGTLPPGLSFTAGSNYISGTPTQAGTYTVPISATNAAGTGSATLTILVANPALPVFTSACALSATVGQSFGSTVSASNTPTGFTFSGLPAGITQSGSSSGYLSGTPTQAGVYTVPVSATNGTGTASATLTIIVAAATSGSTTAAPILFAELTLNGSVGDPFDNYANANTSNATVTALNALPPGLSLNSATGHLTGTPTQAGVYPVTFKAANSGGSSQGIVTITIAAAAIEVPGFLSASTIIALQKVPFYFPVGTSPLAASYSASGLPGGVSIDPVTGVISGTVTTSGTSTITVTATSSAGQGTATLTLTVVAPAFAVTTTPVAISAKVGQSFTTTLTNSGNSASGSTASGLPPGLSINASTGAISGTPTTAGSYGVTTTQTSEYGTVTGHITFFIGSAAPATPVFTSPGGLGGYVDTPFSYRLQATNSPTSFNVFTALPDGLTFDYSTGIISGTPTTAGTYVMNVSASNASGSGLYSTLMITIGAVSTAPLQVTSSAGMWWTLNSPSLKYPVTANLPLFSTTAASNLPPGLSFSTSNNGTISGTPTTAGRYDVKLTLTNGYTGTVSSATVNFRIDASDPTVPYLFCYATTSGAVGSAFSYAVQAIDSVPAVTTANLPPGLSYNASTTTISGTPTTAGTYQIPVSATNANGTRTATLTVVIAPPPAPSLANSSNALERSFVVGTTSSTSSLWYINAANSPTSFAASGLPPGLSLNTATGQITGTLTTTGTYPVNVSASNATGSASAVITYVVSPVMRAPPVIPFLAAGFNAFAGVPISIVSLSATNSPTAYAASGLPPGFALNTTNGQITGTPTTAGIYTVNLSASNAAGTGTAVWTVVVNNASVLYPQFSSVSAEIGGTVGQSNYYGFYAYPYYGGSEISATTAITVSGLPAGCQVYQSSANYLEIDGAPTTAGTYPLTLTATAPGGGTATAVCMLVVAPASAPTITSAAGVVGNVNNAFSYSLYASNTVTAYGAGTLPPGLAFNAATGVLSGTPTTAGTYAVPVTATGPYGGASAVVTIRIDPPAFGGLPLITSAAAISSQDLSTEEPYYDPYDTTSAVNYTLAALNLPTAWTATNLPAGMSFNPYTGVLSGQPATAGVFQVPVSATNAAGTVNATLTILSVSSLAVVDTALARNSNVGAFYSDQLFSYYPALGSVGYEYFPYYFYPYGSSTSDPVTFSAVGLPPGLTINSFTGAITGTLAQAGVYPVTFTATDRAGSGSVVSTFTVAATPPAAPTVSLPVFYCGAQAAGFVGVPLSFSLDASGATSYSATGLPAGITLNPSTGLLGGTPGATGVWPVLVAATNAAGTTQVTLTLTVDAAPPTPYLDDSCAATASIGVPFIYGIYAENYSGEPVPTAYLATGLPAGLSVNPSTGTISGTPTGPTGTYTVPITASVGPATSANGILTLIVQAAPASTAPPLLSSAAGALGLVGNPFYYAVQNAAFAPTSALPAGLTYDPVTGVISGYPTATGTCVVSMAVGGTGNNNAIPARPGQRKIGAAVRPSVLPPGTSDTGGMAAAVLTIRVVAPDFSLPRLTTQPVGGTAVEGAGFSFNAAGVGAPVPVYHWSHNGVLLAGANGPTLAFSALQTTDTGTYTLTASNAVGSVTSNAVALLVRTSYAIWQNDHFSAQEIAGGYAADDYSFSGDGVPNLLKYALDLDPRGNAAGAALTTVSRSTVDGTLQIGFVRDAGRADIDYLVETSTDLFTWTTVAEGDAGASIVGVGTAAVVETAVAGTSQYQVTVKAAAASGGSQFLRLRVIRQ